MYFVYVIQNLAGRFYIGLSEDVHTRLNQHNEGFSKWTKGKGPWQLVWQKGPMTLSEARKLENLPRCKKGGTGFFAITGLEPQNQIHPLALRNGRRQSQHGHPFQSPAGE